MKVGAYTFSKLGKRMAVSRVTGDFFEVPENIFALLERCRSNGAGSLAQAVRKGGGQLDRATIRDILEAFPDEEDVSPSDERMPIAVSDLTLNLTSRCNLACVYCWNDRGTYSNREFSPAAVPSGGASAAPASEEMSLDVARRAVDDLIRHRGEEEHLVVDFYGGEPLLNLPVLEGVIAHCRAREKDSPVKFRFLIATNGTLLTPDVAQRLVGAGVEIAVSVDGRPEVQNHNRPFPNQAGSFDVIRRNLAGMPDGLRKLLVGRATITPAFPDMVAAYHDLRDLGFERIELFESEDACHRITPNRAAVFFHRPDQYAHLMAEWERVARLYMDEVRAGRLNHYNTFFNRFFKLMQRLYRHHEVSGGCPAGRGQIAVACDGRYYPCTAFIGVNDYAMGDTERGLDRARLEAFLERADKRVEHCSGCDVFALCNTSGSCLNLNLYYTGDIAKPSEQGCQLFRHKMELAMAALATLSEECPERIEGLFGEDPSGARGSYPVEA